MYSEEQKTEALAIRNRCLEILDAKSRALAKNDIQTLTFLELESDKLSQRIKEIINNPIS